MAAILAAAIIVVPVVSRAQQPPDPIIEGARKAAALYVQSLPDYIVQRTTKRYTSNRPDGFQRPYDVIAADVSFEHGTEAYTNIHVNGAPADSLPEDGAWSTGEFSTQMATILSAASAAVFSHQRQETIRKHRSYRYEFAIDQAHSSMRLTTRNLRKAPGSANYTPACGGNIWIDQETFQVLRIEMSARGLPSWFMVESIDSQTDYDFVKIGDREYVLPIHSATTTCERTGDGCQTNETVLKNYDKFGSSTSISFDGNAK